MGLCASTPRPAGEQPPSMADRGMHPVVQAAGAVGLQVAVSQARCAATAAGTEAVPLLVRATPQHLFVALFEGLGEDRRSVAAFCRARAWDAFQGASTHCPDNPLEALKATVAALDAAVLASDRLKPAVGGGSCLVHGECRGVCVRG